NLPKYGYRTLRDFEPNEGSEPIGQIFAYADYLRDRIDAPGFKTLQFFVMKNNNDVHTSAVIWRADEARQFKLSRLINDNLEASEELPGGGWTLKLIVKPVFFIAQ
ncbi:hypothetical protein MMC10_011334, partial [Thelotrema lepadinum]|nr:hypothetical protein [Thelotrema lepadinum]